MASRQDFYDMSSSFTLTPEGYLHGVANVTNIGVFTYRNEDGSPRRELRHPDDVFEYESRNSLCAKPITEDHAVEHVNSENIDTCGVGMTGTETFTNELYLAVPLTVTRADAVTRIQLGKQFLSCGYVCDLVPAEPGASFLGMPYDFKQVNIRYNHVSIVPRARAGDMAKIRLDSVPVEGDISQEEHTMADKQYKVVKLDGVDYDAEAKVLEVLHGHKTRADSLQADLDAAKTNLSKIEADRDNAQTRLDALETELAELKKNHLDAAELGKLVKARVAIEKNATLVGVTNLDGMSDQEIMTAVIKAKAPNANLEGKDAIYIQARYDGIVEALTVEKDEDAEARSLTGQRFDSADDKPGTAAEARARMLKRLKGVKE